AWYRARVAEVFREVDVLLAPTTPWTAPAIGAPWTTRIDGTEVPTRGHLGVFTQPLSFIGLPVISVPLVSAGAVPVGVAPRAVEDGADGVRCWHWREALRDARDVIDQGH